MNYNHDLITVISNPSSTAHIVWFYVLILLSFLGVIVALMALTELDWAIAGVSVAISIVSLIFLIKDRPYNIDYTIAIDPAATFEEVSKDFKLIEMNEDGTWEAEYVTKYEDYKGSK